LRVNFPLIALARRSFAIAATREARIASTLRDCAACSGARDATRIVALVRATVEA
jgi:hypothetical protein